MLYLYAINLASHPKIPRYRKIFTSNDSFQRVDSLNGARALLRAVGFQDRENALEWEPGEEEEEQYLSLINEVSAALGILKSPGKAPGGELLDQVLDCISGLSMATPAPKGSKGENETVGQDSTLPEVYKTPDPSILSPPPVTKKQGMHPDPTVSFSPHTLDSSPTVDSSFFADSNTSANTCENGATDTLLDADSVWK